MPPNLDFILNVSLLSGEVNYEVLDYDRAVVEFLSKYLKHIRSVFIGIVYN
jgi:hypothetical protein